MKSSAASSTRRSSVSICASISLLPRGRAARSESRRAARTAMRRRRRRRYSNVADPLAGDRGRLVAAARARDRRRRGVRVGSRPDANRLRSLVASSRGAGEDVHVLIDQAADPHHQVVVDRRRPAARARGATRSSTTRCAAEAVRTRFLLRRSRASGRRRSCA